MASSYEFSLAKSENNWPKVYKELYKESVIGENTPRQTGEWVCIFTRQS
jgi:hypothetical protein